MVEVKRKQNESTGSMLRRFNRLIQQTGVLVNAKRSKYFSKKANERKERQIAIMREELSALRKRLEKMGTYSEEVFEEEKKKIKQKLGF